MWKLRFISINNLILVILGLSLILALVFGYLYLFRPISQPRVKFFLLQTEQMQIKKELFRKVITNLEERPQKAQNALDKFYPDIFKF